MHNLHALAKLSVGVWLLIVSLCYVVNASPLPITDSSDGVKLGPHYQLYVDSTHRLTINDILSTTPQPIDFEPIPHKKFNLGYQTDTYWFHVTLRNTSDDDLERLLEFHYPLLDHLSVYIVDGENRQILQQYHTGDKTPFDSRVYKHPNFVFPIELVARADLEVYFKIDTDGSMTVGSTLWKPDSFPAKYRLEYFAVNIYLGLLIGLIFYNFLLFFAIREISYLYHVLFGCSLFLALGSFNGLWYELFWPNAPYWQNISVPLGFGLSGLFAVLFSQSFLETETNAPISNRLFQFIGIGFVLTLIALPFVPVVYIAPTIALCAVAFTLNCLYVGIRLGIKGNHSAQIYLIAWLCLMVGTALFSMRNAGWVPSNIVTRYGIMLGSALEMILLSFALAQRINFLRAQNDRSRQQAFQSHSQLIEVLRNSERELSQRVKKRTYALATSNKKLREQEEKLKKLAHYDPLTGLANRTLVIEKLDLLLRRAKREKTQLAVLFLDLNGFKLINDNYGHKIGDELLIATADKLRYTLRESDIIGRIGGDEFIVLVDATNGSIHADEVIHKIKHAVATPIIIDGEEIRVGVSVGIAYYPEDGDEADQLISASDKQMYQDKAQK